MAITSPYPNSLSNMGKIIMSRGYRSHCTEKRHRAREFGETQGTEKAVRADLTDSLSHPSSGTIKGKAA